MTLLQALEIALRALRVSLLRSFLTALGIIKPEEAFGGFANSGMLTVGALFIVAAALRETGVMEFVGERFLGHVETEGKALFYMAVVLIPSAMVLNNTPKVALLVPVLIAWCRKRRISPSRLLMPLSFLSSLKRPFQCLDGDLHVIGQGVDVLLGLGIPKIPEKCHR